MEAQGASQIWDVIKNLEINSGSISNEGADVSNAALGNLSGTANINLRNLGENSTLTLINGKRQVAAATTTPSGGEIVDINTIPLVMVDRVEVLTDGGSALYGSDAVAGAVNIIMRTDFEGLDVYGDVQKIESAGSRFDKTGSVIWGWANDSGSINLVLAGEMFRRDAVPITAARWLPLFTGARTAQRGEPSSSCRQSGLGWLCHWPNCRAWLLRAGRWPEPARSGGNTNMNTNETMGLQAGVKGEF